MPEILCQFIGPYIPCGTDKGTSNAGGIDFSGHINGSIGVKEKRSSTVAFVISGTYLKKRDKKIQLEAPALEMTSPMQSKLYLKGGLGQQLFSGPYWRLSKFRSLGVESWSVDALEM